MDFLKRCSDFEGVTENGLVCEKEKRQLIRFLVFSDFSKRGVANREEILEIIEKKQTLLAMNGHDHGNDLKIINNIPYFTVNSMSYIWHGMKEMYMYTEELHRKYPSLKDMILYETPLYCIVEIEDNKVKIYGMDSEYQNVRPEDVGIMNRMWNGVSIEPRILSWESGK